MCVSIILLLLLLQLHRFANCKLANSVAPNSEHSFTLARFGGWRTHSTPEHSGSVLSIRTRFFTQFSQCIRICRSSSLMSSHSLFLHKRINLHTHIAFISAGKQPKKMLFVAVVVSDCYCCFLHKVRAFDLIFSLSPALSFEKLAERFSFSCVAQREKMKSCIRAEARSRNKNLN